jgi:S-adenosylmethionine hydrolase
MCGRGHPRTGLVSATFHGRDLFAPAAARLALGEPPALLGPQADAGALGTAPSGGSEPRLVWIDAFGNGISNLAAASKAGGLLAGGAILRVGGLTVPGPYPCYADAPVGQPFWYWGSGGTLEIGVPGGSAAAALGLRPGLVLEVSVP